MALDEPAGPAPPDGAARLAGEVERRLVEMVTLVRLGTCAFLLLPLAKWDRLDRPWIAAVVAAVAVAEASWFAVVTRRRGTVPRHVVLVDVACCVLVMGLGSRAVGAADRNVVMTELIPYSLGGSAAVGLSTIPARTAAVAVGVMMVAWVASLAPVLPPKTLSDLLGFVLWVVIGRVISTGWRRLARTADQARAEADRAWHALAGQQRLAAEAERRRQLADHREALHREVHDFLLPVVEHVAASRPSTPEVVDWAGRTARRARRQLEHELGGSAPPVLARLADVVTAAEAQGLRVRTSLAARYRPPLPVVEAMVAAAAEALTNAAKHAASPDAVLAALDLDGGLQITVRDHGRGFDPERVTPGGGLARSFAAVRSRGGRVRVESAPGEGTRVSIHWAPDGAAARDGADGATAPDGATVPAAGGDT